jgi:hypothetical protein
MAYDKTDYIRYDYVKVAPFSNVSAEIEKSTQNKDVWIDEFMHPLIEKIALSHPHWDIIAYNLNFDYSLSKLNARRFRVFEGNHYIGSLNKDGYSGQYKFEVDNERIRNTRYRRGGTCTKDIKKAIKAINEHFIAPTNAEVRLRAIQSVSGMVNNEGWKRQRSFDGHFDKLTPLLRRYVVENIEAVRPALAAYGVTSDVIDDFCKRFPEVQLAQDMSNTYSSKRHGVVVLIEDGKYALCAPQTPEPYAVLNADELPDDVKRKLGVLKIVPETGTPIEAIGMRISDTVFYVLPQEQA